MCVCVCVSERKRERGLHYLRPSRNTYPVACVGSRQPIMNSSLVSQLPLSYIIYIERERETEEIRGGGGYTSEYHYDIYYKKCITILNTNLLS